MDFSSDRLEEENREKHETFNMLEILKTRFSHTVQKRIQSKDKRKTIAGLRIRY